MIHTDEMGSYFFHYSHKTKSKFEGAESRRFIKDERKSELRSFLKSENKNRENDFSARYGEQHA